MNAEAAWSNDDEEFRVNNWASRSMRNEPWMTFVFYIYIYIFQTDAGVVYWRLVHIIKVYAAVESGRLQGRYCSLNHRYSIECRRFNFLRTVWYGTGIFVSQNIYIYIDRGLFLCCTWTYLKDSEPSICTHQGSICVLVYKSRYILQPIFYCLRIEKWTVVLHNLRIQFWHS